MKKRHEQKLVILAIALFVLLNIPLVLMFNGTRAILGFPIIYFSIFTIWLSAIIISFIVLKRHFE